MRKYVFGGLLLYGRREATNIINFPSLFACRSSQHSWRPIMTSKTTTLDYWWNWRVLLCAIWVLSSMMVASILIWKYEGSEEQETAENQEETHGTLYDDESWRPCLKSVHPAWLLAFRVVAFFMLSALLIAYVCVNGTQTFYYYTQWTFALVIIYFGLGSILSIYGCNQFLKEADHDRVSGLRLDEERGGNSSRYDRMKRPDFQERRQFRHTAGIWGYVFQIIYQTNAGAVMLTDFVFWLIIVPFLEMKDYDLSLLTVGMHSVNAIFLLGDTALNSLRFPWFRISYFLLWTAIYVFFQWIVHACISIWWPYPFLDLSSQYSPIWYLLVAALHIPCYAIFFLIVRMKHWLLSRCFPYSFLL